MLAAVRLLLLAAAAVPRLAYPRGFAVRTHGVRVLRRAPLTLRGSGRASITVTRR